MDHIDDMEQLRQGIGLQAYGQKDPKVEYKMQAYDMFNEMSAAIQEETIQLLYHVKLEQKVEREEVADVYKRQTENGVEEQGTHEELLRQNGIYAMLYNR